MSEHAGDGKIRVEALDPEYAAEVERLARKLNLPVFGSSLADVASHALQVGPGGVQFVELGEQAPGAICVDFLSGAVAHRRQFGGGTGQMIAKAVGIQSGVRPSILDATAGLGRDAFVLAQLGCPVTLIERQAIIAVLLEDGLRRARLAPDVAEIVARMHLVCGDAVALMQAWSGDSPQVIYLDPMFPHREKTALVKKEMRLFRPLAGDDADAHELLEAALALASHRVVVKRPRKAPALGGTIPGYVLEGKSSRFDIYPKRALK